MEINKELTVFTLNDNNYAFNVDIPYTLKTKSTLAYRLQQVQDSESASGTFSFTDKNANATALDDKLTGDIQYGAVGDFSSAFGGKSSAQGKRSMAVGTTTIAKGKYSFASGDNSVALGNDSHAEGYSTVTGPNASAAHSEGYNTQAIGHSSHSEGNNTEAKGDQSHAEGVRTKAIGGISHSEGVDTEANADNSHVEGNSTATKTALPTSSGSGSSEGSSGGSTANPDDTSWNIDKHRGVSSHAEGVGSTTYGYASHAEGFKSVAYGHLSHAEGDKTTTGAFTGLGGWAAHAEGQLTVASGDFSHAGGVKSSANGTCSFAHGSGVVANGDYSTAFGLNTKAAAGQFVCGRENVASEKARFIVGNAGVNAFEVLNDGRAKVQSAPTESNDVVTKGYVDTATPLSSSSDDKIYLIGVKEIGAQDHATYGNSNVYATKGNIYAYTFNATSDARLKENIVDYTCEKSILDLPIKKFDFIDGPKNQIGCIAQDLQSICPEIVAENGDGYLSIKEGKIVYLLLQEVKKLKEEVDKLKEIK